MADISHTYGQDLDTSATGDLLVVAGSTETTQHVLKRIITPGGGYIWHLDYGAGAGLLVGDPANELGIKNAIRTQIFLEQTVSQVPEPVITVDVADDGTVTANVTYVDAVTGEAAVLQIPVSN